MTARRCRLLALNGRRDRSAFLPLLGGNADIPEITENLANDR
jgi:hypothetical protein